MKTFTKLSEAFRAVQLDLDNALQAVVSKFSTLWYTDMGYSLDSGLYLDGVKGGLGLPHAYRDRYGDDVPKEERLFLCYSLWSNDEFETSDGGDLSAAEAEFIIRCYASNKWARALQENFLTYMGVLDDLQTEMDGAGWIVSELERAGDVDSIDFDTYVFFVSALVIKKKEI